MTEREKRHLTGGENWGRKRREKRIPFEKSRLKRGKEEERGEFAGAARVYTQTQRNKNTIIT